VQLIEREGAGAFSMRRIASELGTGVMSLYNYVPGRAAVLDGVAERILSGIDFSTGPGASWEEQVRAQARAFREVGRTYPRCTMVVVSRPVDSAGSLRPIEVALATLSQAGWLNEISSVQVQTGTWEFYADENFGGASMRLSPGQYPNLAPEWTKHIGSFQCVEPTA